MKSPGLCCCFALALELVGAVPSLQAAEPTPPLKAPAASAAPGSKSSPQKANPNAIAEIQAEGIRRVEREAALAGIKSKVGEPLDDDQLTADLRAVWQTGFFRDVHVEKEKLASGWRVVFVVVERPSIREVKYVGRNNLSEDDLKGVTDVKPYTILNVELLKKNVEKIKDLYVQKGYYLAEVKYRIEPVPDAAQEVDVFFDLTENARVLVREISFYGNNHLSSELLKSGIQTREGGDLSWLTQTGTYKEEFFQTDLLRIQSAYYDQGYVTVKMGEPSVTISPDRRYIYLGVSIAEGEQYKIGHVRFSGDVELKDDQGKVVIDEARLRKMLSFSSGDTFNRTKLFNDINVLTDAFRDRGYAFANVTPNSAVHEDTRQVDLDLEIERGDMVYFDHIEVAGNTRTRDRVIRRELKIYEGERYTATGLSESRARVFALGFFETVNVTTTRGSKPDRMDVRVEIKEKSTGSFQVGAGFSSVENFVLQAQIAQNNFLGNGWLLSMSAQLSLASGPNSRKLVTVQASDPYFLDTNWSLGADGYLTQRYYSEFERDSTGISPRLGYPISDKVRLSVGYTIEKVKVTSSSDQLMYGLAVEGLNSAVNANISYDTRDNRLFPSAGQFHSLSGEFSHPSLGSDPALSFWRAGLVMRYYYPLPYSFVLKLNAEFGWVGGIDGRTAPLGERYFPGGILSVRGFESRGLGPTVPTVSKSNPSSTTTDFTIGGNKQAVFNLEVEFPLVEAASIKGLVFFDAGNAFNDDQNFFYINTPKELKPNAFLIGSNRQISPPLGLYYSFGFGFRWFSPIGPLRFEWGIPITRSTSTSRNIIFEFMIGNFF